MQCDNAVAASSVGYPVCRRGGAGGIGRSVPLFAAATHFVIDAAAAILYRQMNGADAVAACGVAERVFQVATCCNRTAVAPYETIADRYIVFCKCRHTARDYEVQGYDAVATVGGGTREGYRVVACSGTALASPHIGVVNRGESVTDYTTLDGQVQGRSAVAAARVNGIEGCCGSTLRVGLAVPCVAITF